MEKLNKWCLFIILLIIIFFIGYEIGSHNNIPKNENMFIQDTTYNHITLDSIQYNIIIKDSIIYNLKEEMKYEIDKSRNLTDSASIDLFQWLVTSTDDFPTSTGE